MSEPIVKICGLKTVEAAECAINNGANLLGVILVPNRARTVDDDTLKKISTLAKSHLKLDSKAVLAKLKSFESEGGDYFQYARSLVLENGPFLVGVFRNQTIEVIQDKISKLNLDFVQLHGSENFEEYIGQIDVPVITRYVLNSPNILQSTLPNRHVLPLFDSELGGEGKLINWQDAENFGIEHGGEYLLAGGLTPENVGDAVKVKGCLGVDVAGGVETNGEKDFNKIKQFITNAKRRGN